VRKKKCEGGGREGEKGNGEKGKCKTHLHTRTHSHMQTGKTPLHIIQATKAALPTEDADIATRMKAMLWTAASMEAEDKALCLARMYASWDRETDSTRKNKVCVCVCRSVCLSVCLSLYEDDEEEGGEEERVCVYIHASSSHACPPSLTHTPTHTHTHTHTHSTNSSSKPWAASPASMPSCKKWATPSPSN
jgi:hypothetical protein